MKSFFSLLIVFISFNTLSQSSVEINYNDVYIGRNLSLSWKKCISNFSISSEVTYHLNRFDKVPIGTFIYKSAHAENVGQKFGIQIGLEYMLVKNSHFKLGLFYNNQISFINQVHKMYYVYDTLVSNPKSEFDFSYTKSERTFGPFLTIDNTIGLTLKNSITDNLYLTTKGGVGILFWKNTDENVVIIGGKRPNQDYNFTSLFSIGIGYTFIPK